jgi:hypothetical protein
MALALYVWILDTRVRDVLGAGMYLGVSAEVMNSDAKAVDIRTMRI